MVHRFSARSNRAHEVRWRDWEPGAFAAARAQDRLVMVAITAFWCGFCQRMDETTFSQDDVIALLNAYFIPIRVEESQRPDIDLRYAKDGWPTIAFLTPHGDYLTSVNFTPPEPFADLLVRLHALYQDRKAEVLEATARARADATQVSGSAAPSRPLGPAVVAEVSGFIEGHADGTHGGFAGPDGNKMLHPEANDLFLYLYETTGDASYLDHVVLTLTKMRRSRTHDEVDGGFYRYSSRADWREPHPEKLLADQAGLLRNYLHAYLVSGRTDLRETAEALVRYLDSTLSDPATGAFYGCQDYIRPEEAGTGGPAPGPRPLRSVIDTFVYTDANAQAISAYLDASWVLDRPDCKERALRALEALWERCRAPDGGMYHYFDGEKAAAPGILMDAVATGRALLDAYRVTGEDRHLERAALLADEIVRDFRDPAGGLFDIKAPGLARLERRLTPLPQNAAAADLLLMLAGLRNAEVYRREAVWALQGFTERYRDYGPFAAGYGHALGRALSPSLIMTVAGAPGDTRGRDLARAALTRLRQGGLVVRFAPSEGTPEASFSFGHGAAQRGPFTDPEEITPERVFALR